eukprot:4456989-Pyramimonas_sp.AAC.1
MGPREWIPPTLGRPVGGPKHRWHPIGQCQEYAGREWRGPKTPVRPGPPTHRPTHYPPRE